MSLRQVSVFSNPSSTTTELPNCVDIFCRELGDDRTKNLTEALKQAGVKYRIHEVLGFGRDMRCIQYDKPLSTSKSLYVIFIVKAIGDEYIHGEKIKLFSADGQLGALLKLLDRQENIELYKRIHQAIKIKDPQCQIEIITNLVCRKKKEKYQTLIELPEIMSHPVTMRFISSDDWETLADICKAKLMSTPLFEPDSGVSKPK